MEYGIIVYIYSLELFTSVLKTFEIRCRSLRYNIYNIVMNFIVHIKYFIWVYSIAKMRFYKCIVISIRFKYNVCKNLFHSFSFSPKYFQIQLMNNIELNSRDCIVYKSKWFVSIFPICMWQKLWPHLTTTLITIIQKLSSSYASSFHTIHNLSRNLCVI